MKDNTNTIDIYRDNESKLYSILDLESTPRYLINHFLVGEHYYFDSTNGDMNIFKLNQGKWSIIRFNENGNYSDCRYVLARSDTDIEFITEEEFKNKDSLAFSRIFTKVSKGYEYDKEEIEGFISTDSALKTKIIVDAYLDGKVIKKVNKMTGEITGIRMPKEEVWDFGVNDYSVYYEHTKNFITQENINDYVAGKFKDSDVQ